MRLKNPLFHKEFYLTWLLLGYGALACYFLTLYLGTPPALSSSLTTLAFWPLEKKYDAIKPSVIFCGSFIGMGEDLSIVLFAPIVAAILSVLLKSKFVGLGGKLGAIAFVSSLLIFLIKKRALWIF
jgi:hypothetical protein